MVNTDDDNNDNDEIISCDRRCKLFVYTSDVKRKASKELRVFSLK